MTLALRFTGSLEALSAGDRQLLRDRSRGIPDDVRRRAREIVATVAAEGDVAVRRWTRELDRVEPGPVVVPAERVEAAVRRLPKPVDTALRRAASNIETFHRACAPRVVECETEPGVLLRRVPHPVARVAVYAPGGRASYPSSVLMGVIPAKVAGCRSVAVVSPPGSDGVPPDPILAAAAIAGADRVYAIGGAQAIGALGYGTETVAAVDRIVGPGNAYVTEAKLAVAHRVGIDGPAGPTELLAIVDRTSPLDAVAIEMIAQAEHDPDATVVALVIGDQDLCRRLLDRLTDRVADANRGEIVRAAFRGQGGVLFTPTVAAAQQFANEFAAEHLLLATAEAEPLAAGIDTAGAVFVGPSSSVVFGDYLSGGNHVLPTSGLARAFSGLGTETFVRWVTEQRVDSRAAARLSRDTALLATIEGFPGHRAAAEQWQSEER
ncbi:MAG: histidinol dehydrogenase [Gemmatimonadetes bacterium]|nr:histidinol dehydrogenase [Gemmatimonadota bacterium]